MLCRWDVKAYDVGFLLASLDYVLDSMGFDSRFEGRRFGRPARLYLKALVLKEVCKASLRYTESLSKTHLGVRIPKSTLHYWEVKHGDTIASRGYDESLYAYRSVGEGIFGALTVEFGDRLKKRREGSTRQEHT
jgi:hypothetical protein